METPTKADVAVENFVDYVESVDRCMSAAGGESVLSDDRPIMLKPNLVNASPHPVTTPPEFCEAVITFVRKHTTAPIVIAEGCGDAQLETHEVFNQLGYDALSKRLGIDLVDLNTAPLINCRDAQCSHFPEMWLPREIFEPVIISLPVLKAHSLCGFTGSMKNMMGTAPPEHYSGYFGTWKKAVFHECLDAAITDLNHYRTPDFTVMDATIGLADFHLGGRRCNPPVNRILAGVDARAVDRLAAEMLGLDWQSIGHLA